MSASSSKLAQDECEVFEMNIGDRTENAISDILPLCVKEFEELLNSDKAKNHNSNENSTPYHHSLQSCGKKLSVGLGLLHNYITVEELIAMVKPTIYKLADAIKTIRVWILLHVPEAADCSNIQMEVQERILSELREVEAHLSCYQTQVVSHFLARGKIMRRVMKFPNVKDYSRFIEEADESQAMSIKLMITTLRNACLSISHAINRNMDVVVGSTHTKPDLSGLY